MSTETSSANASARIDIAALGPYVSAAALIHGPAPGNVASHLDQVVKTAVKLAVTAQTAVKAAMQDVPIRSIEVTGVLSVTNTNNSHRTQIGVDTGASKYGADQMWTDFEEEAAAKRTRAVLQSLVGRTVTVTKQTFYEYDHNGEHVLNDKQEKQTRTRMADGSLFLIGEDDRKVAVEFSQAPAAPTPAAQPQAAPAPAAPAPAPTPAAPAATAPPENVDVNAAFGWLVQKLGEETARRAWSELDPAPVDGTVTRSAVHAIHARYAHTTSA